MYLLTKLIKDDMRPALGVTEPGAIAYAVASARDCLIGEVDSILVELNSGMYKNAYTCGIPGSRYVGNLYAAAFGAICAKAEQKLECLSNITEEDEKKAERMIRENQVRVKLDSISSKIFIRATVRSGDDVACVTIRDAHTNIVRIEKNGNVLFEKAVAGTDGEQTVPTIHKYTLAQLVEYAKTVPLEEISFIESAYETNMALFEEGLHSEKTSFAKYLYAQNGQQVISEDEEKTAQLLCNAAIEARVIGLDQAAMSITGSGAHGIIATLPLYAVCKTNHYTEEQLLRATALSYLVCMYIKEYSGKLSAFCGCAIAAGTGMACGLVLLKQGSVEQMVHVINNMASSITGMICDGGNQGCTMKGVVAVSAAFASVRMAMQGVFVEDVHGINGSTPEKTMKNMGMIASPGMEKTEDTILDILKKK